MESEGGRNSSIVFCTTGVLLRVLVSMGSNSLEKESSRTQNTIAGPDGITHIIVVRYSSELSYTSRLFFNPLKNVT